MLHLSLLDEQMDFEELNKGDLLVVKWSDYYVRHTIGAKKIMTYNVVDIKTSAPEIILRTKNNHFFNWLMYLENRSNAEEVYAIYDV